MIKVVALTSGMTVPSTRFRVRQHIAQLAQLGVEVSEYVPAIDKYIGVPGWPARQPLMLRLPFAALWAGAKLAVRAPGVAASWRCDAVWLERPLLEGFLTLEPLLGRPLIFDVDDAVWLAKPWGEQAARWIAQRATVVVAGNRYLAEWFGRWARDVRVVPTAVDTERFRARDAAERDRFVIGWTGISPNFSFLYAIEAPLERILRRLDDAELLVVADRPPEFRRIDPRRVRFIAWSPATEAEAVRQMDVGLMPLADSEWARGKCSFKMLQYMACGVPVVVSPVGMNADVLAMGEVGLVARDEQEWCEAIELLYADRPRGRAYGAQGRAIVERHFSRTVVATQLAGIFQEIVQCTPAIPAQQ